MKTNCIFCQIITGSKPRYLIYEDKTNIIFLDHRPVFPGHCLITPKQHVAALEDLDEKAIAPLFILVQKTVRAIEQSLPAEGTFMAINNKISQSVPHLHIHVIPRNKGDGLKGFFWPRISLSHEQMVEIAKKIKESLLKDDKSV